MTCDTIPDTIPSTGPAGPADAQHWDDGPMPPSGDTDRWAWVAAEPFGALLRHLLEASQLPLHHLAHKLGLPLPLCARLLADRRPGARPLRTDRPIHRIPIDVAERLLRTDAVSLCAELDVTLSAHRARAAIRSLLAEGHRLTTLHRVTGLSMAVLEGLAAGTATNCSGRVDAALQAAQGWAETHPAVPMAGSDPTVLAA